MPLPELKVTLRKVAQIAYADSEYVTWPDYSWDNRGRSPAGTLVIQRSLAGTGVLRDETGREFRAAPGHAMLFRYGEDSSYWVEGPENLPYHVEYAVIRPYGGIPELLSQILDDFGRVVLMEDRGEAARLLHALVEMFHKGQTRDQLEMAELAYRLMLAIYREQISGVQRTDPVAYLRHLLQSQFRSPRNLTEWTSDLRMSREHLTRQFHERYGVTPAAFLRGLRVEQARLLAQTSSMSLDDIAVACGFGSTQTLRRAYQRVFGAPIGDMRPAFSGFPKSANPL